MKRFMVSPASMMFVNRMIVVAGNRAPNSLAMQRAVCQDKLGESSPIERSGAGCQVLGDHPDLIPQGFPLRAEKAKKTLFR